MKTVCLPDATWAALTRQLTVAVGSDDRSRELAALITEQTSGRMTVRPAKGGANVTLRAGKGGDLRGVVEALAGKSFPA